MTIGLYQRFDTPAIAPRDRFEYWRDSYSKAVDGRMLLEPIDRLPLEFDARAEVLSIGQLDIVQYRCGPAIGSWTLEATETHDRLRLALLPPMPGASGRLYCGEFSLANGAIALIGCSAGCWRAPAGWRGIQVNVPRATVAVSDAQLERINDQRRIRHDPTFAALICPTLLALAGRLDAFGGTDIAELEGLWISLLGMLVRSLLGDDTNGIDTAQARRAQARRHIRANLADPRLSPDQIADALHISRSTLYAALSGDSDGVAAEIRRQRLNRAHAILLDPTDTRPIADIAAAVGLPKQAQFSRSFRARYGLTPRELRATAHNATTARTSPTNARRPKAAPISP
jgi:AraC-like DNA-binding protein